MAETKYGHLVKKLDFQKSPDTSMVWLKGSDLEGLNLSFIWACSNYLGKWGSGEIGLHSHPYGECLILTGLDYNNRNQLGAEIEITMGEGREKYALDAPSLVIAPPGIPHGPIVTHSADKTYGFLEIHLGGEVVKTDLPERSRPPSTEEEYGHLVQNLDMRDTNRKSGGNADYIAGWSGKDFEDFGLNFTWAFHTGLGTWHERDPHVHPYNEVLLFVGLNSDNPEDLGAEIEIAMGKELEKHVFDTSTIIVAPGGLVHCPLITRRVDRPYGFSAICLNTEHTTTWLGEAK